MRLVPPTSAERVLFELDRIVSHARCNAAMELEHAVSVVTDGPLRLLIESRSLAIVMVCSNSGMEPTKTN